MYYDSIASPLGIIHLLANETGLQSLCIAKISPYETKNEYIHAPEKLTAYKNQLHEYFMGKRQVFDLPLALKGTDFQNRVWQALCAIPFGETRSYANIAAMVGSPKAYRAVGMANNVNPIPIIIPCHRVIGSNGKLTGFAYGLDMKKVLLLHEKISHFD